VVVIGLTAALLSGAAGRRKLWDLDLSKFVNDQTDPEAQVWGIRFSPDETKVAIGFGLRWKSNARPRHVAVVAVDKPQTVLREFDLKIIVSPWPSGQVLLWSPSGAFLVARTRPLTMLRFDQGASCNFPEEATFGGFLSEDRMVLYHRPHEKLEIQILKPDCSQVDSWTINGSGWVLDTSPEKDLLAIQLPFELPAQSAIEVMDSRTHEVRQRWTRDSLSTNYGGFLFSSHGGLVCSASSRDGKDLPDAACWDTQTGAKIAENDKVAVDRSGVESTGGDLVAITDYRFVSHQGKFWVYLDMNDSYSVPKRRLIWNVRTGKEVASWGGDFQQKELWVRDLNQASAVRTNFVLSLSPSGKYVAEGGSGSVSAYALEH
jgi:hypothetical protein